MANDQRQNHNNRTNNQQQQLPLYTCYDLDAEAAEGAVLRQIEARQRQRGVVPPRRFGATAAAAAMGSPDDDNVMMMYQALDDRGSTSSNSISSNNNNHNKESSADGGKKAAASSSRSTSVGSNGAGSGGAAANKRFLFQQAVRKVQTLNSVARTAKEHVAAKKFLATVRSEGNESSDGDGDASLSPEGDGLLKKSKKDGSFNGSNKFDHHLLQIPDEGTADDDDGTPKSTNFALRVCHHPVALLKQILYALQTSLCIWLAIPLASGAYVLFYYGGNPDLDFLPGSATLSWWMNFFARLCVTLEIAYFLQYLLVDGFLSLASLTSRRNSAAAATGVDCTGGNGAPPIDPLVTLILLQSKGWPLCLAFWSLLNLLLLQGDNQFQRHWLFFLGWEIYSSDPGENQDANVANSGDYILESEIYLRLLVSGILVGSLVGLKRTYVALYFGGQQLKDFQPRLEMILADIVILSEIAILAATASSAVAEAEISATLSDNFSDFLGTATHTESSTPIPTANNNNVATSKKQHHHRKALPSIDFGDVNAKAGVEDQENNRDQSRHNDATASTNSVEDEDVAAAADSATGSNSGDVSSMKKVLERWEEPTNKRSKSLQKPSINDILRFRRALNYCNDTYPFGKEFGLASNRDNCIKSSHEVFQRLLDLVPTTEDGADNGYLPFRILAELAYDDESDSVDHAKMNLIRRRFRPDASNNLSLYAFVQSCDSIYKRLRFFKASLDNASVISNVLERVTNAIFFFVLVLLIISVMKINPWNILVPFTSLLVSFSFALGASISKYVEGILMITIRRPYDLGDRIFFSSTDGINPEPNVTSKSWFVEDITLTTTTLRYSRTNEVSTVSNSSISGLRIVNCNQSPLATVFIEVYMHESIFDNENLHKFRAALNKYVADRPRTWDSVSFCRHDEFDADNEKVKFAISVRHRNSWQDSGRIKSNRADLVRFLHEKSKEMGVHYDEPPPQQVLYYGGALKSEVSDGYKRELLSPSNIRPMKVPPPVPPSPDDTEPGEQSAMEILT